MNFHKESKSEKKLSGGSGQQQAEGGPTKHESKQLFPIYNHTLHFKFLAPVGVTSF